MTGKSAWSHPAQPVKGEVLENYKKVKGFVLANKTNSNIHLADDPGMGHDFRQKQLCE